jgi:RNA polymerase sigma-70 factor (ECF subfamily)
VRRFLNDHDNSLDVAQDVFVRAYQNISSFRGDAQVFTWLYRIAMNLSLNHLRREKLRGFFRIDDMEDTLTDGDSPSPQQMLEGEETSAIIRKAIDTLPKKQKQVFLLRYYEEMPYEEIAVLLQTSVGGLKANYFHAVRKIEEQVKYALRID